MESKVDKGKITQVKSKDIRSMFTKVSKNMERLEGANEELPNVSDIVEVIEIDSE